MEYCQKRSLDVLLTLGCASPQVGRAVGLALRCAVVCAVLCSSAPDVEPAPPTLVRAVAPAATDAGCGAAELGAPSGHDP